MGEQQYESGSSLDSLLGLQQDIASCVTFNYGLTGTVKPTYNVTHFHPGKLVLRIGFFADALSTGLCECPPKVEPSLHQGRRSEKSRWKLCLQDQPWKSHAIMTSMFCRSHRPAHIQCAKGLYKGLNTRGVDFGWSSWRLATTFFSRNSSIFSLSGTERQCAVSKWAEICSDRTSFPKL